ncbi:transcription termination RNA polymerase i, putative, partial [Ichthyophthirius multifiliis]
MSRDQQSDDQMEQEIFNDQSDEELSEDENIKHENTTQNQARSELFNPNSLNNKRKWKDLENKVKKEGKFTEEEGQQLIKSLQNYAILNQLSESQFLQLFSQNLQSKKSVWNQISECLPQRSILSCYNYCKRKFNQNNYKGKWNQQETQQLINLVNQHGNKWKLIANIMGKTATNIRDKYKQIGQENFNQRQQGFWSLDELINLIKLIQQKVNIKVLQNRKEMKKEYNEKAQEYNESSVQQYNKVKRVRKLTDSDKNTQFVIKYIDYENFKLLQEKQIKWTEISKELKTKSKDDCKNKWNQHISKFLFQKYCQFTQEEINQ